MPDLMVPLDLALAERTRRGEPVRVGVVGAGWLGRRVAAQVHRVSGLRLAAVVNRSRDRVQDQLVGDGVRCELVDDEGQAIHAFERNAVAVASAPEVVLGSLDALIETTGDFEFATRAALAAVREGVHLVIGAELDATVGPMLKRDASARGSIVTGMDGDEPAVNMNLIRLVRTMGLEPVMAGNIKGFLNHYRDPASQVDFASAWGQNPRLMASFADGTKLAAECTVLANATGFTVWEGGMRGFEVGHISELPSRLDWEELIAAPKIDYTLGAQPGAGGFVVAFEGDPSRGRDLHYLKMGEGPLHVFTRPFHLPQLETPLTAARAVLWNDAAISPQGAPVCEAVALAKRDLAPGELLDGVGGFCWYARVANRKEAVEAGMLPMGLAEGATVRYPIKGDAPLTYEDVELAAGAAIVEYRARQDKVFGSLEGEELAPEPQ